jgi:hypothetical protein
MSNKVCDIDQAGNVLCTYTETGDKTAEKEKTLLVVCRHISRYGGVLNSLAP